MLLQLLQLLLLALLPDLGSTELGDYRPSTLEDFEGSADEIPLISHVCPEPAKPGNRYLIPEGGWRAPDCTFQVKGSGRVLLRSEGTHAGHSLIKVERGRNLQLAGDFTLVCTDCHGCHRAIYALGATVALQGLFYFDGYCSPAKESASRQKAVFSSEEDGFLQYSDGGTIAADTLTFGTGSQVRILNSRSDGSGGAIAAHTLTSEEAVELYVVNATSEKSGGGIALKLRNIETDGIVYSWKIGCRRHPAGSAIIGVSRSPDNKYVAISSKCCPTKIYSIATGELLRPRPEEEPDTTECIQEKYEWVGNQLISATPGKVMIHKYLPNSLDVFAAGKTLDLDIPQPGPNTVMGTRTAMTSLRFAYTSGKSLRVLRFKDANDDDPKVWKQDLPYEVEVLTWWEPGSRGDTDKQYGIALTNDEYTSFTLCLPKTSTCEKISAWEPEDKLRVTAVEFSPDGGRIAMVGDLVPNDGQTESVGLYMALGRAKHGHKTVTEVKQPTYIAKGKNIRSIAWSAISDSLAWVAEEGGVYKLWVHGKEELVRMVLHTDVPFLRFDFLDKKMTLFVGNAKGRIHFLDPTFKPERQDLAGSEPNSMTLLGRNSFEGCSTSDGMGGSIYVEKGNMRLEEVHFEESTALVRGGALKGGRGMVTLKGVTFGKNTQCLLGSDNVMTLDYIESVKLSRITVADPGGGLVVQTTGLDAWQDSGPPPPSPSRLLPLPLPLPAHHEAVGGDSDNGHSNGHNDNDIEHGEDDPDSVVPESCRKFWSAVECPLGQQLQVRELGENGKGGCYLLCRDCEFDTIFNPVYRRCSSCPMGISCERASDLRSMIVSDFVEPEVVDSSLCRGAKTYGSDEAAYEAFYLDVPQKTPRLCYRFICNETNREMRLGKAGCRPCPGPGYAAEPGKSICEKIDVNFEGPPKVRRSRRGWLAHVKLSNPGVVTCEVKKKSCLGPQSFVWIFGWRDFTPHWCFPGMGFSEEDVVQVSVGRDTKNPHLELEKLEKLPHGYIFSLKCKAVDELERVTESDSVEFSRWFSWYVWAAINDWWLVLFPSGYIAYLWYTAWRTSIISNELKKRRVAVAILYGLLIVHLGIGVLSWMISDETKGGSYLQLFVSLFGMITFGGAIVVIKYSFTQRKREQIIGIQLDEAQRLIGEVQFPVVLLRADEFRALGTLRPHETLRDADMLLLFDTISSAKAFLEESEEHPRGNFGVFFSHQWTSFQKPDPSNTQYNCMLEALGQLAEEEDRSWDNMYVWVDYFCIPQANPYTQRLAINSLPIYASLLQAFVIVAPSVAHEDRSDLHCDRNSYQRRGWCRAEQLCHCVRRGTADMYLADGKIQKLEGMLKDNAFAVARENDMETVSVITSPDSAKQDLAQWFSQSMYVFDSESEYTCCRMKHNMGGKIMPCDREALVLPMLGLYSEIVSNRAEYQDFYNVIYPNREKVFPPNFVYTTESVTETKHLFSDLLDRLEKRVTKKEGQESSRFQPMPQPWKKRVSWAFHILMQLVIMLYQHLSEKARDLRSRLSDWMWPPPPESGSSFDAFDGIEMQLHDHTAFVGTADEIESMPPLDRGSVFTNAALRASVRRRASAASTATARRSLRWGDVIVEELRDEYATDVAAFTMGATASMKEALIMETEGGGGGGDLSRGAGGDAAASSSAK